MKSGCGFVLYFLPHNAFNKTRFVRCIYSVVIYDTCQKRNISYTVYDFTAAQITTILDYTWYLFTLQ